MGNQETFKAAVWYNGKVVNQDGNNPRYVGGIVKFINVDPNTDVDVFLCTVRDIFGIPEAVPITIKYHIFFSSEISKLLDVTPYESLKSMLQPGLILHPFYVEENVVAPSPVKPSVRVHVDGSLSHDQAPVLNPIPTGHSNKQTANAVVVGDRVGTSSTNSSQDGMVDPSATKGQGSAGNELPSSTNRCQSPKIPSSLLSDNSSLTTDVLSLPVRVSDEENLSNTGNHQNVPEKPENKIHGGCSFEISVNPSTPLRLDICNCKVKSGRARVLKPSLFAINREILKASLVRPGSEILRPGMVLLRNHISHADQMKIIKVCRDLGLGAGRFYQPGFKWGGKMNLHMMCLGMNWDPEEKKYGNRRSVDDAVPPGIPDELKQMVKKALTESHALINEKHNNRNPENVIPLMQPDICIINFYAKTGNLDLHQDKDESKESLYKGLPVVSISIGDSANFMYGDQGDVGRATTVVLESGDVLIFGGKSRHVFHGVTSIIPDTAPKALAAEANLRPGRLNLTFRKY